MDRASRPRHREVPSGDRKGKAAKRRMKSADRVAFFLGTFSWPRKKKYLARQGEKFKNLVGQFNPSAYEKNCALSDSVQVKMI